jgi:hypothetical protein
MGGTDFELPLPEASPICWRAAIASRLEVHPLSFDLSAAGGEDPRPGRRRPAAVIDAHPPIFMLQRVGIAFAHASDFRHGRLLL